MDWSVNAYAICADPLPGQQVISHTVGPTSAGKGTSAICPVGQVATGSAAEIPDVPGDVVIESAHLGSSATTTAYGRENDGTNIRWSITAHVMCADA